MSAFDVWLWLKLDDIRAAFNVVWVLFGLMGAFGLAGALAYRVCGGGGKGLVVALSLLVAIGWTGGAGYVLTPTTKQAAAIYVVPQLVESRVFTNDIPQLYGMAVDALKEKLAVEVAK